MNHSYLKYILVIGLGVIVLLFLFWYGGDSQEPSQIPNGQEKSFDEVIQDLTAPEDSSEPEENEEILERLTP